MIPVVCGTRFGDERLDEIFNWRLSVKRLLYTVFELYSKSARVSVPGVKRTNEPAW